MKKNFAYLLITAMMSCGSGTKEKDVLTRLITLDPGHFHAALVQKKMYEGVDSVVHVYAPGGLDVQLHLDRITSYNSRPEAPTHWSEIVYTGSDFFEKMFADNHTFQGMIVGKTSGDSAATRNNVVVLSGNNQKKTDYILKSVRSGFNVLADKPMAISTEGFKQLEESFTVAGQNNLLLYDIMTERFEITTILQRELSMIPEIFGKLESGTVENPAITKESVHHFYKHVSGNVLTRPHWFFDIAQQGEGIVDVMTHLVDLVQWECFPDQAIEHKKDVLIHGARRWTTDISISQFKKITKLDGFPLYLKQYVLHDTLLKVHSNGEINYELKGLHARTSVVWKYESPEGAGDTHYSVMRGTLSNLVIRQGEGERYRPVLYIDPVTSDTGIALRLNSAIRKLEAKYPGIGITLTSKGWQVIIPEKYREGHEAHFGRVMDNFLQYLRNKNIPSWEIPNMLAKYYTTTKALEIALKTN